VQVIDFIRVFILAILDHFSDNSLMGWEIGPPEIGKVKIMGLTVKEMKANLARERQVVKDMIGAMKATRSAIKASRAMQSALRAEIRREAQINRVVKEDHRAAVKAAREAKRAQRVADRIAKAEARLAALRLKASAPKQIRKSQQKASPVKVWSAEEIAALNA
jgi:regulator of protease activity HflC (stomatin/prohibitin superfamily)